MLYQHHVELVAQNIQEYLHILSPRDRLILGKHFKQNGDYEKLALVIKHSHISERELCKLSDIPYICTLQSVQDSLTASLI